MAEEYLNRTLTVDCGLHTGWAYWSGTNKPEYGEFSTKEKDHFQQRSDLSNKFYLTQLTYKPKTVYLEGTQAYSSMISQTAIRKGTLFELSYLIGRYEESCFQSQILDCKIINAPEWKGQMSKEITAAKIKMLNGITYPSEHITDAVGMGFGIIGAFTWVIRKDTVK